MTEQEMQESLKHRAESYERLLLKFLEKGIPTITAIVMAGDYAFKEEVEESIKQGKLKAQDAIWLVGSYARMEFCLEHLPREKFLKLLPELWIDSDPYGLKEARELWINAYHLNNRKIITDGKKLKGRVFKVFRGGVGNPDLKALSWTLDENVARKFSISGGGRGTNTGKSYLISKIIKREEVLAYLTGRGEEEVLVK